MNITEEKILNGIKYFIKNTNNVGRTKLFKLLYFWDFYYFEKHGKSITGMTYFAYPFGPVPKNLYESISRDELPDYLKSQIIILEDNRYDEDDGFKRFTVKLKNKNIDLEYITPYEKESLDKVVEIFKYATAKEMTEASHFHNMPWKITVDTKGMFSKIDYILGRSKDTPFDEEEIKERLFLQNELTHNGFN